MSEQISASVPNPPLLKQGRPWIWWEVDSNEGQQFDLYLQYLADGLHSVCRVSSFWFLKCFLFCKDGQLVKWLERISEGLVGVQTKNSPVLK